MQISIKDEFSDWSDEEIEKAYNYIDWAQIEKGVCYTPTAIEETTESKGLSSLKSNSAVGQDIEDTAENENASKTQSSGTL